MFLTIFGVLLLGGIIILANLRDNRPQLQTAVRAAQFTLVVSGALLGILVLLTAFLPSDDAQITVSPLAAAGYAIFTLITTVSGFATITSRSFRIWVQRYIFRSDYRERFFHADSPVHITALVIALFGITFTFGNFLLLGGFQGLANELSAGGYNAADLLTNLLIYSTLAILGIGAFIRRDLVESLQRLGLLIRPDERFGLPLTIIWHVIVGVFVGAGLFVMQIVLATIWQFVVSPEMLANQTAASEALFAAISGSLWLGFLLALTAGVGEELLFRGALQPIFGNVAVSIFFVLLHSQYTLTPAALIIFVVSLGFGLLRSHYSTVTAIIAHFVYNFAPFVLLAIVEQFGISLT